MMIDEFHNHHSSIIHKCKAPDREPSIDSLLGALLDDLEESSQESIAATSDLASPLKPLPPPSILQMSPYGERAVSQLLSPTTLAANSERLKFAVTLYDEFFCPDVDAMVDIIQECRSLNDQLQSSRTSHLTDILAMMSVSLVASSAHAIPRLLGSAETTWSITCLFHHEACHAMQFIYQWYTTYGPDMASTLFHHLQDFGESSLSMTFPTFSNLVSAIFKYACATSLRKKQKTSNGYSYTRPFDMDELRIIPPDLYGLVPVVSGQSPLILPKINNNHRRSQESIIAVAKDCFMELLVDVLVVNVLGRYDGAFNSGRITRQSSMDPQSKKRIFARAINRGYIVDALLSELGQRDSIFFSPAIIHLIESPFRLFSCTSSITKEERLAFKILQDSSILQPLHQCIRDNISHHPEVLDILSSMASIGDVSDILSTIDVSRESQLSPPFPPSNQAVDFVGNSDSIHETLPTVHNIVSKPPSPLFGQIGIMLWEVLNQCRERPFALQLLHRILCGLRPTQGHIPVAGMEDLDLINPIRGGNNYHRLLSMSIPSHHLTSSLGISWLLTYMATGQGFMTQSFLKSTNVMFSSLDACIAAFVKAEENHNRFGMGGKPTHYNPKCWGQYCPHIGLFKHTGGSSPQNVQNHAQAIRDKLMPFWDVTIQDKWVEWLGCLAGQNPSTYTGLLPTYHSAMEFISNCNIIPFQSGLTQLQFVNNLAFMGICQHPSVHDMSLWIIKHQRLGAYAGLKQLGFKLHAEKKAKQHSVIWVKAAFQCVYDHLDIHLCQDDKDELKFGVIFLEHLLCKLVRWQGRFEKRARTDFVRMGYDAQVKDKGWIKGLNVSDETGLLFPIPLMASDSQLHTSIDKSLE